MPRAFPGVTQFGDERWNTKRKFHKVEKGRVVVTCEVM